jgi:hypothetical protein
MECELVSERYFTSLSTLEELGQYRFQRSTVENDVSSIIERLSGNPTLQQKFRLQGSVIFENHTSTLSPESQLEGIWNK